jgi:PAT family beta-lactamase induction signal transducer AmpG
MPTGTRPPRPWTFVPGLYVLQGMPYFAVHVASTAFLTAMGAPLSAVGRWSSDLTLPWMLKALWSPLVDLYGTKRRWLLGASIAVLAAMLLLAWATGRAHWFEWTIAACFALALASATYDVACDGYYMLALGKREQEAFVGVRNACYRLGRILVAGGVVTLAGALQADPGAGFLARGLARPEAWGVAFACGAAVYACGVLAVAAFAPRVAADAPARADGDRLPIGTMLSEYVQRPRFAAILAFILLYRFAESMLTPMIVPFLMRGADDGGLGLHESHVGWIYGTVGVVALLAGGIGGGWLVSRYGLARLLWPMALAMHAPNVLYAWAAHAQPGALTAAWVVGVEQLGYGFGFSAYMVYLLQLARASRFATTHYAISTGLMGLSAWLAGRWSGHVVTALGFENFFWLVSALGLAGLATLVFVPRLEPAPAVAR